MTVRDKPISALAGDLEALANRLRALSEATARDLLPVNTLELVRESNADIWATRGAAIGQRWGTYGGEYPHPLPKFPGITYWLIDTDYFNPDGLRSSLTQLGRSRNSVVTWRKRSMGWRSIIPYADSVNTRYGTIYGLTPTARTRIFSGLRRVVFSRVTGGAAA